VVPFLLKFLRYWELTFWIRGNVLHLLHLYISYSVISIYLMTQFQLSHVFMVNYLKQTKLRITKNRLWIFSLEFQQSDVDLERELYKLSSITQILSNLIRFNFRFLNCIYIPNLGASFQHPSQAEKEMRDKAKWQLWWLDFVLAVAIRYPEFHMLIYKQGKSTNSLKWKTFMGSLMSTLVWQMDCRWTRKG
jgi:hypothetical protein